jgi:CheY-like chemotaxis protein
MKKLKSILLVEDDKDDQNFFINALNEIENTTLYDVAENGKEAIDKLKKSEALPDLIFTDINMPVMNGIEWLTEIINYPYLRNIPVVILSSSFPPKDVSHQLEAAAFIKKTSDQKKLRSNIEKMINSDITNNTKISNMVFRLENFSDPLVL